jgi:hypothetical protein
VAEVKQAGGRGREASDVGSAHGEMIAKGNETASQLGSELLDRL